MRQYSIYIFLDCQCGSVSFSILFIIFKIGKVGMV